MEASSPDIRSAAGHIFIASFVCLGFEVALIRIFSITLWHHFAFMVLSIAMLGLAGSGTLLSILPGFRDARRLPWYGFLLGLSIPAAYLCANAVSFDPAKLSWDQAQLFVILLYYLILGIPFFLFGLMVSTAYAALSRAANRIYAFDLCGAGLGAIAMIGLLSLGSPDRSMFVLSALLAAGIIILNRGGIRFAAGALLCINMSVLAMQPVVTTPRMSPYKPFSLAMQYPGTEKIATMHGPSSRIDLFKSPAVRFAPGLSLNYLDPLPDQTGVAVDGADIFALTHVHGASSLGFVRFTPASLAFRLTENHDVLVIEPCSSLSLLIAEKFKARNIIALDSNPLLLQAMRGYERGRGASLLGKYAKPGLARAWLAAGDTRFDVIDLSVMSASPSTGFGFAEDYRFTVEAFGQYLAHLKSDGFLSLNLYLIPPARSELRLAATLADAAGGVGIRDVSRHLAVIRTWNTVTLLMKRSELTRNDIDRIRAFCREMRFDLVHYPGIKPEETNVYVRHQGNEYADAFRRVLDNSTRRQFLAGYLFDIRPATDEKPFFRYHLKIENSRAIYRVMGEKWQYFIEQGYLLPVLFVQAFCVSAALVLLPLIRRKRGSAGLRQGPVFRVLFYFALLGAAYLFIELALIQKMILVLENPSYAASAVIASVLISSGLGGFAGERISPMKSPRMLLMPAGLAMLYGWLLPQMSVLMGNQNPGMKLLFCILASAPAGFLMGIPFPLGMSLLGSKAPHLIPWAWAVNGCFSVLAPILAAMLALSLGFRVVLLCGSLMYAAAFLLIRTGWDDREERLKTIA